MAFDLHGNLVPADVASTPASKLFQSLGSLVGEADDSISGEMGAEPSEPRRALLEHWLEITFIVPGRPSRTVKRTLFRTGDADAPSAQLSQETVLTVRLGAPSLGQILDATLQQLQFRLWFAKTFIIGNQSALTSQLPDIQKQLDDLDMMWGHSLWAHFWPDEAMSGRSYLSEPLVVAKHRHVFIDDTRYSGIDVVSNPRRSFIVDDAGLLAAPELSLRAGVRETVAEHAIGSSNGMGFNTIGEFEPLLERDQQVSALTTAKAVPRLPDVSAVGRLALVRDLESGYVVVPAPTSSRHPGLTAWWRVNPNTGETLGMGTPGWGIDMEEYEALMQEKRAECLAKMAMACRSTSAVADATAILQQLAQNAATIDQAATMAIRVGGALVGEPAAPGVPWGGGVARWLVEAVKRFGVDRAYRQCMARFSAACHLLYGR